VSRLRRQRGFTLIELLIAMSVGSVVMLATFNMLDGSVVLTGKTQKRVDATERGRLAMEVITRQLRSQVCPTATTPAIVGGGTSPSDQYKVNFWTFLGTGTFTPERHEIAWDTNTNSIVETDYNPTGTLLRTRRLLTKVRPPATPANAPVFSYYSYPTTAGTTALSSTPLPIPLSAADAATVALVKISFTAQPDTSSAAASSTPPPESQTFSDQVFSRTADPNNSKGPQAPVCG
jgi:prepilin-type N-terminal cleavage/methylation domain-containing protein